MGQHKYNRTAQLAEEARIRGLKEDLNDLTIEEQIIAKLVETIYRYKTNQLELKAALALLNMPEDLFLRLCEKRGDIICARYDGSYKINPEEVTNFLIERDRNLGEAIAQGLKDGLKLDYGAALSESILSLDEKKEE